MDIITPTYYNKFNCIGGKCRNNCCNEDWKIVITKDEYDQIKNCTNTTDWATLESSDIGYASINNKDGGCAFFDSDGLCKFQKEYGYDALNRTCQIFPRYTLLINDVGMIVCSTGCEEVVRLLMNEPYIELTSGSGEISSPIVSVSSIANHDRPLSKYIFDLQTVGIAILQDRFYTLDQRMVILSSFLLKVDTLEKTNNFTDLATLIDETLNASDDIGFVESYNRLVPNIPEKMSNASSAFVKTGTIKYINNINFKVIENNDVLSVNYDIDKYIKQLNMLDNYLMDKPYLENIMVNIFLQMLVPFKLQDRNISINTMYYITLYNTLKTFLATYTAVLDDKNFIDATVIASRKMLHNSKIQQYIIDVQSSVTINFDYLVSLIV